jgi:hypothetical protein
VEYKVGAVLAVMVLLVSAHRYAFTVVWCVVSVCLTTGCTRHHSPEQSKICNVTDPQGWAISKDRPTNAQFDQDGFTFIFDVFDTGSANDKRGAVPGVYWIQITGLTFGSSVAAYRRPMIYDPREALLELGEKKIKALPRIWFSEQVSGFNQPVGETETPTDLNVSRNTLHRNFFIAFPVEPPKPKDAYVLRLGSIVLDGKRRALPVFGSCHFPAKTWHRKLH